MIKSPFTRSRQSARKTLTESVIEELTKGKGHLLNEKVKKISYEISSCCHPIPGDEVMGFIHPNEAIEMHRTNCGVARNKMSKFGNRIIKTTWNDKESIGFIAGISIHGIDRKGFINDIIRSITETFDANIKSIHLDTNGGVVDAKIMIYVYSTQNLKNLIEIISKTPDVSKVTRLTTFI
jgi:GTP pyrophosphokinase